MPLYTFKCPCCGATKDVTLPYNERDMHRLYCDETDCRLENEGNKRLMTRVPTTSGFIISGYAEKNGYSKS